MIRMTMIAQLALFSVGCFEGYREGIMTDSGTIPEKGAISRLRAIGPAHGSIDFYRQEIDGHLWLTSVGKRRHANAHHPECEADCHHKGTCLPAYPQR